MEEVKYIQLGLENVEVINIRIENIESLAIDGVYDEKHEINSNYHHHLQIRKRSSGLKLIIKKDADQLYDTGCYKDLTVFQRLLKFPDIVDITYLDKDKKMIESIYVPWKDISKNEDNNAYQIATINKDGSLVIIIKGENND